MKGRNARNVVEKHHHILVSASYREICKEKRPELDAKAEIYWCTFEKPANRNETVKYGIGVALWEATVSLTTSEKRRS
ncbi:hypothetical protein M0804_000090 [Polistes exclamans]|nr:hypothetical protein M0804_000090 [Polistes exclamans]